MSFAFSNDLSIIKSQSIPMNIKLIVLELNKAVTSQSHKWYHFTYYVKVMIMIQTSHSKLKLLVLTLVLGSSFLAISNPKKLLTQPKSFANSFQSELVIGEIYSSHAWDSCFRCSSFDIELGRWTDFDRSKRSASAQRQNR